MVYEKIGTTKNIDSSSSTFKESVNFSTKPKGVNTLSSEIWEQVMGIHTFTLIILTSIPSFIIVSLLVRRTNIINFGWKESFIWLQDYRFPKSNFREDAKLNNDFSIFLT